MKHNTGGWVDAPLKKLTPKERELLSKLTDEELKFKSEELKFKLTDDDCERLRNTLGEDRIKTDPFIDSCKKILRYWLPVANEDQSIAEDRRNSASQIQKTAQKLIHALNTSPGDVNEMIAVVMNERLYLSNDYPEHTEALDYLRRATGYEHPGLYQMADIFECWLSLLFESAAEVAAIKNAPCKNKGREKWLVSSLAVSYEHHFGKPPAAGTDSYFRIFCSVLSEILEKKLGKKITIGKEIIKEVIDLTYKSTLTPKNP